MIKGFLMPNAYLLATLFLRVSALLLYHYHALVLTRSLCMQTVDQSWLMCCLQDLLNFYGTALQLVMNGILFFQVVQTLRVARGVDPGTAKVA